MVRGRSALEPEALLDACKAIEVGAGRAFGGPRHGPAPARRRPALLGDLELETERLTLPHREVATSRFVLVPLLELEPELALPNGTRLSEALEGWVRGRGWNGSDRCDSTPLL